MPELRRDPVIGRWVIIAMERSQRPSDYDHEAVIPKDPGACPFCPGHEEKTPPEILAYRDNGRANERGWRLRVVPNKFPALRVEGEVGRVGEGIFDRMNGVGAHEVFIESPAHRQTLADASPAQVEELLRSFRDRIVDLRNDKRLRYVIIFKNHGEAAGASLEHSHCQLIALPVVPKRVVEEMEGARRHFEYKERCIYCDIVHQEASDQTRVIQETDHFLVVSPYAARLPFETWVVPKRHHSHYEAVEPDAISNLAKVLGATLKRINRVLNHPPYNAIIHSAPIQEGLMPHYHWHIELIPKLAKTAGFEWGTGFYINPTPPEDAALYLREALL